MVNCLVTNTRDHQFQERLWMQYIGGMVADVFIVVQQIISNLTISFHSLKVEQQHLRIFNCFAKNAIWKSLTI